MLAAQHLAQAAGVHAACAHALRKKGHDDGGQQLQQLGRAAAAQARGLAQSVLRALLVAAQDVAQDGRAIEPAPCIAARACAAAQQRAQQAAEVQATGTAAEIGRASCRERV